MGNFALHEYIDGSNKPFQFTTPGTLICTAKKKKKEKKFSFQNFLSKCDQIRSFLMIWSRLLINGKFHFLCSDDCGATSSCISLTFTLALSATMF